MEPKSVIKVGIVALIGLALCGGLYYYLSHLNLNTYPLKVVFDDTLGLTKQSVVRMQGVVVGEVEGVELNTTRRPARPVVTLAINKRYNIPIDSSFIIVSGILITTPQLQIQPGRSRQIMAKDGTQPLLTGAKPQPALAALSPDLVQTTKLLNTSLANVNAKLNAAYKKIDRILDQTQTLMVTVNKTAKSGQALISDPHIRASLTESLDNVRLATQNARDASKKASVVLVEVLKDSKGKLDNISNKLVDVLGRIDTTIEDADTVVKKLTDQVTDPRLQNSLQETVALASATLARFNQIASDLDQIVGDPTLQSDLKQSVTNIKHMTEGGEEAVRKLNTILGKYTGEGGGAITPKIRLPKVDIIGNISEQFNPARLRLDVDAQIHIGDRRYVDVGIYNLGETNLLNLQMGSPLASSLTARYGLYASKLGVGLDYSPPSIFGLRADLFGANSPQLDVRGLFRVNRDAAIWIGADSLFNDPIPRIGFQLKN
jgi:phospholipid/cholesterol/gamma-HCH transport system substrate-binding protein